jgi:hypothetical protein
MRGLTGLRCRQVRRRCWRYLDGTLSARARAGVERHLVGCVECRAVFAQAAFALEALQKGLPIELERLPYPPHSLKRHVRAVEKPSGRRWGVLLPLLVALIGLVGGIGLVRLLPPATPRANPSGARPQPLNPTPPTTAPRQDVRHATGVDKLPKVQEARATGRLDSRSPQKRFASQAAGKRKRPLATPPKRAARPSQPRPPVQTHPPQGTIEVYDPSGQLVKRDRVRGNR